MKVTKKQANSHHCLVCGLENNLGIKAQFYETENKEVVALFEYRPEHQSYPGRAHGGMIGSLLDELVGRAIWITNPNMWGVTMTLNIKYRKPVPIGEKLKGVGRIDSQTTRTFNGSGEIYDKDGNILAEASAVYMKLPLDKISDMDDDKMDIVIKDNITDV